MRTNAFTVSFCEDLKMAGHTRIQQRFYRKVQSLLFCIYLYVQIQRIRCKNIYIYEYIYITSAISFLFSSWKHTNILKKDNKNGGNSPWHPEEHVLFQKPYSQPSPFLPKVVVYTSVSAFLRFVLCFIFYH